MQRTAQLTRLLSWKKLHSFHGRPESESSEDTDDEYIADTIREPAQSQTQREAVRWTGSIVMLKRAGQATQVFIFPIMC